ncbi:HigA family addiction module antitoxin [Cytophagaceae bacterium DM2B3-1]|uniref:HigA family addiction module antitoxin n=1 Tax=Xanthocytophaga flava TaxID=3048013 RepID=A0ABT7CV40_9BACT|nr:HigA family addiction module antitoxin [Xanthocytophaga flavus]MDJ1497629.1 HigA family addiction module antitoxin [Xanthocytophaga flavus]
MSNKTTTFQPDWISCPGSTIADILEERNMTISSFAQGMDISIDSINNLIDGKVSIDQRMASKLAKILGSSEQFWLKRQQNYDISVAKLEKIDEDRWLRDIPLKEIKQLGWIQNEYNDVKACLNFFGITTVKDWYAKYEEEVTEHVVFRTSPTFKSQLGALACWLRKGEQIGSDIKCKPWNISLFESSLKEIRQLTKEKDPKKFIPKLRAICAEAGVAIAMVPPIKGCRASGAAKFITPDKALLIFSFRYLSDDHFWFSFFHEAGHLILHSDNKNDIFLEGVASEIGMSENNYRINQMEEEANSFAGETLIPHQYQNKLFSLQKNKRSIISFALEVGVSAGIIIGQLQHYGIIKRNYLNDYKRRYNRDDIFGI